MRAEAIVIDTKRTTKKVAGKKAAKKAAKEQAFLDEFYQYGADVLDSEDYYRCAPYIQHGNVSTLDHQISVSCMCLKLAKLSHAKYDYYSLIRAALLHDFFLYDWHDHDGTRKPLEHGFQHGSTALANAADDFSISPIEANSIRYHMFPLTMPPRYREGMILSIADKICMVKESIAREPYYKDIIRKVKNAH